MGLALLDGLTPWRSSRVRRFLEGAGAAHAYMVHVGVGWAHARLPGNIERRLNRLDPDQPLLQARLLDAIGQIYQLRGHFPEAESLLRESLALRLEHLYNEVQSFLDNVTNNTFTLLKRTQRLKVNRHQLSYAALEPGQC